MIRHLVIALACTGSLLAADAVDRALSHGSDSPFLAMDLVRAVDSRPAGQQAGALARIGDKRSAATDEVLRQYLGSHDPVLATAAVRGLGAAWPTTTADAAAVRALIGGSSAPVADAACAFAAQVGDDRAIPVLIARLDRAPASEPTSRALLALTGHSAETSNAWSEWWQNRSQATRGMIDRLGEAVASGQAKRIDDAMIPLLGERRGASDIADLLIQAAAHPVPAIAEAAEAGLSTCPGPVAACWRAQRAARPVVAQASPAPAPTVTVASVAPAVSEAPANSLGTWLIALALCGAVAGFARMGQRQRGPTTVVIPATEPAQAKKKPRLSITFSN